MTEAMRTRFWVLAAFVGAAAVARLLPLPPNVQPTAAMALFAGVHFDRRSWALAMPVLAMAVSDLALEVTAGIGIHALIPVVYGCMLAMAWIGPWVARRLSAARIAGASIAGSLGFFAVTNTAVWLTSGMYPLTSGGLVACYAAALPFLANSMAGTLGFSAALFGAYFLLERRYPVLARPAYAGA